MVYYTADTKSVLRDDDGHVALMSHDLIDLIVFLFTLARRLWKVIVRSCLFLWFALYFYGEQQVDGKHEMFPSPRSPTK